MVERIFRLGLIVNPIAGVGGPAGLKGSDGNAIAELIEQGATLRAGARAVRALGVLAAERERIHLLTYPGAMGEESALAAGFTPEVFGALTSSSSHCPSGASLSPIETSAEDTRHAAEVLCQQGVDLLVFVGGDGTARDIYNAIGDTQAVLGVPAGVKMHSGVYAVSPEAAGDLIVLMLKAELVNISHQEVRDIDEEAFRRGVVKTRFYGELSVPQAGGFLQQVKQGGREVEELVLADIAADLIEQMEPETLYIIGPGSTTQALMQALSLDNTLLGVDVIKDQALIGNDLNGSELEVLLAQHPGGAKAVITAIGGQGHILGRGNQQLTPTVLRRIGLQNIIVIATKTKIKALQGRPLLVDTHDPSLDREFAGYIRVTTGYQDTILYPLGHVD